MKGVKIIIKLVLGIFLCFLGFMLLIGVSVYFSNKEAEDICNSFEIGAEKAVLIKDLEKTDFEFGESSEEQVIVIFVRRWLTLFPATCSLYIENEKLVSAQFNIAD